MKRIKIKVSVDEKLSNTRQAVKSEEYFKALKYF